MKKLFFKLVMPISKLFGKITAPWIVKRVNYTDYNSIFMMHQQGDVLLSYTKGHLTNLFIAGEFKHAAMVCDGCVIEAIGEGVVKTALFDFLRTKDRVALLRPNFCTAFESMSAAEIAKQFIGYQYDYLFEAGNKQFYCSELWIYCYNLIIGNRNPFKAEYEKRMVEPNDFFKAKEKFILVYDSKKVEK